jgi:hypothetical protein
MRGADRRRIGTAVLAAAVWRDEASPVADDELAAALHEAQRNQVSGLLARAYPARLAEVHSAVAVATGWFRANLTEVTARLARAGIVPVLIKADPEGDYVYTNFDLVVGDRWAAARRALAGWYVRTSGHPLEPDKVLLHPRAGPAAHLHRQVSWFGVPVISAATLAARATPTPGGWYQPAEPDQLRIWLAHAVFQNLALDLSELLAIRGLLRPDVLAEADAQAHREGWRRAYRDALRTARTAIAGLDDGTVPRLPVPLRAATSIAAAREHVPYLLGTGQTSAAGREAALRGPLAVVKRCRLAFA